MVEHKVRAVEDSDKQRTVDPLLLCLSTTGKGHLSEADT